MKTCVACGMPMRAKEDFAMGDEHLDYCKYCARPDGSMQSYDEKLDGMTNFVMATQGLERAVARKVAAGQLAELPAWKDRKGE